MTYKIKCHTTRVHELIVNTYLWVGGDTLNYVKHYFRLPQHHVQSVFINFESLKNLVHF